MSENKKKSGKKGGQTPEELLESLEAEFKKGEKETLRKEVKELLKEAIKHEAIAKEKREQIQDKIKENEHLFS